MAKFTSTYPEGWKEPAEREDDPNDIYAQMAKNKIDTLPEYHGGILCIAKTVEPEVQGQPNKMATFGEMLKIWDHVNVELYQRLISIKYHNA